MQAPLKASGWWNYKIPPLLGIAYFALSSAPNPPSLGETWFFFLVYFVAVVGIAGFGHVLLDAFDVDEDRLLGKANLWAPLSTVGRVSLLGALLAASWLPWVVLPGGAVAIVLVALEFALFALYAVPPIRLKNRGFAGITADALYAHALPALWTWVPFSIVAGAHAPGWFPALLAAWALTTGMRHLLQHQVIQLDSDRLAGAATHAVRSGREVALATIVRRVMPLDLATFALLLVVIGLDAPLVPVGFAAYILWQAFKFRFIWMSRFSIVGRIGDADRATVVGTLVMTRFYERWFPLLLVLTLAARFPSYLPLLFVHILLFRKAFAEMIREDFPLATAYFRSGRSRANEGGPALAA
jgi:hypothetical protein